MKDKKKPATRTDVAVPDVDLGQVERILAFMAKHRLEEFEYARGDLRIHLKKPSANSSAASRPLAASETVAAAPRPSEPSAEAAAAPPRESVAVVSPAEDLHIVKSPIVGTFYEAPTPGAEPFVKVGDIVKPGQVLCIVEAMKLMNEIEADVGGEIVRGFVENGHPVEYGEPLFAIRPRGKK